MLKLRVHGAIVLPELDKLPFDGARFQALDDLAQLTELKFSMAEYFESLSQTSVQILADVIQ